MAMKIGRERKPYRLRSENWKKNFQEVSLADKAAEKRMLKLVRGVRTAVGKIEKDELNKDLIAIVTQNIKSVGV